MSDLVKTARRAKGSDLLPKVSFGVMNAAVLILRMADRIEELEAERDEALNQLDSARHSVEVLEVNVARMREATGKALERLEASAFTNAEHAQAAEILRAALQDKGGD